MPSAIKQLFGTIVQPACSWASLGNGAGRICDVVDNTSVEAPMARLHVRVKTGTSPTVNTAIKFYLIPRSNDGTTDLSDYGLGTADAAVSAEPLNALCVLSIQVSATSNVVYDASVVLYDLPPKYSIVIWNATGVALNSGTAAADKGMQIVPITPEAQ